MTDALTPTEHRQIILKTAAFLIENYAYPDLGQQMAAHILELLESNHYKDCVKPPEFGAQLTDDLRAISNDRHLLVGFSPALAAELDQMGGRSAKGEEYESHWWAQVHSDNFGLLLYSIYQFLSKIQPLKVLITLTKPWIYRLRIFPITCLFSVTIPPRSR